MIHRVNKKQHSFTQINNHLINDQNISCSAKGILTYLLSKPDTWQFYEKDIENHFSDNIKVIRKYIKELIEVGYMTRIKTKDDTGKFIYIYDIYESPKLRFKNISYDEYLQTDHWKKTRQKALKKANYKCELCNEKQNLNVHHKTYENLGYEPPEDLIVLCKNCHSTHHDKLILSKI